MGTGYLKTADGQERPIGEALPPIECFRCGLCCMRYQPPVVPEEVTRVADGLGLSSDEFLAQYCQLTYVGYLLRRKEEQCIFLDWEDKTKATCRIHASRPEACRNWAASLSRRECRDGLSKVNSAGKIILPSEICPLPEAKERLLGSLKQD